MPTVEKTSGAKVRVRGIGEFDVGDRAAVSTADAQYLVEERGDFEYVDEGGDDGNDAGDDDVDKEDGSADDEAATDNTDEDGDFKFDPGEATDFETNGWLDNGYRDRAEAVRAGGLDDFLDEIEAAETSETVIEAVDERRAELEG